jgi:hypothetical protein
MPKVIDEDAFRVYVPNPPREHGPAHVRVENGDGEVVITLPNDDQELGVREVVRMRSKDVVRAVRLVESHLDLLIMRWRQLHG